MAQELGLPMPRIAVVGGDDLSGAPYRPLLREQLGAAIDDIQMVSANAYIGAEAIAAALDAGAQIVVAGRVADPSLTVGPAMSHFGWRADDWDRLGRATMAGHLLECGAQVCGGYFADPGYKDVPGLHAVGLPNCRDRSRRPLHHRQGRRTPAGCVSLASVKEQLLYEVHDPAAYLTPDVVADISAAQLELLAPDRVRLERGARPRAPGQLEGQCLPRGRLAGRRRNFLCRPARRGTRPPGRRGAATAPGGLEPARGPDRRAEHHGRRCRPPAGGDSSAGDARDVRLRVAATHADKAQAERLAREVTAL